MAKASRSARENKLNAYNDQAAISPVQAVAAAGILVAGAGLGAIATKDFYEGVMKEKLTHAEDVHNQKIAEKDARIQEILSYGTDTCKRAQNLTQRGYGLKDFPDMFCEEGKSKAIIVYGSRDGANVAKAAVGVAKIFGLNASRVKPDTEVTDADKAQYHMIGLGGPCVNSMTQQVAAAGNLKFDGKDLTCNNWPGENFGLVSLAKDFFASGRNFMTIAGTRASDTDLAAQVLAEYDRYLYDIETDRVIVQRSSGTGDIIVSEDT
jgi:flavodoxin